MTRAELRLAVCAAALAMFIVGLTAWEQFVCGWHFAREEVPGADLWHWARGAVTALLCLGFVGALAGAGPPFAEERVGSGARVLAWSIAALALALTLLLALDPARYQALGTEDSAIEWVSALLLFAASVFSALHLRDVLRRPRAGWLAPLATGGFALLFFVMAMEEVSWFQRVIGFATPEAMAQRNWQGEFNLHNFQTDLTELALYTATGLFLMLLPLVRAAGGQWRWLAAFRDLLPDRTVAALSAPMLVFTYSHWNLLPVQAAFWIGLGVCLVFARWSAGAERMLWVALTLLVAAGQLVHLALGHTMLAIYDSSEFRELFFAIGLAAYGWRQWRA